MRRRRRVTAAVVLALAATGVFAPASAAPRGDRSIQADVDGDGHPDEVTVQDAAPGAQRLSVDVDGESEDATFSVQGATPAQPPRALDIDGDHKAELLVAHSVGANTVTFNIWKYDPERGLVMMKTPQGNPFEVSEGGGVSAVSGYSCAPNPPRTKEFVTLNVELTSSPGQSSLYSGHRINYAVDGDALRPIFDKSINGEPRIHSLLITNPSSCAA